LLAIRERTFVCQERATITVAIVEALAGEVLEDVELVGYGAHGKRKSSQMWCVRIHDC